MNYDKPLSIEQIFNHFDKNRDGKIKAEELVKTKNSIFEDFTFQQDMTLEQFEQMNLGAYKAYEIKATRAWAKEAVNSDNLQERNLAAQALEDTEYAEVDPTMCRDPKTHDW